MDLGLPAQDHAVEAVDEHGDEHDRVADIHVQRQQAGGIAMAGDDQHAGDGDEEAEDLRRRDPEAEQEKVRQEDHHRDGGLLDAGVHRRGEEQGAVERHREYGEAEHPGNQQEEPARPEFWQVGANARPAERKQDDEGQPPAQGCQQHGGDVADGELARDRIAAPEKAGQEQQDVGDSRGHDPIQWVGRG